MYQTIKPIAISRLAISHFTNTDYIYQNQTASAEIRRVYKRIIDNYPRIKMINYMDYDEPVSDPKRKSDYYTITENAVTLSAYRESVAGSGFLSSVEPARDQQGYIQLIRSPFPVLKIGQYWYASEYSFLYDLNTKGALGERMVDGRKYYNMNAFLKNGQRRLTVDDEERILVLTEKKE